MTADIDLDRRLDAAGQTGSGPEGGAARPSAAAETPERRRALEDETESAEDIEAEPASQVRRAHRLRGWRSPLTRRILALNVLTLLIPVLGLLHLDQYRQSLIDTELDAMRGQALAFSLSLGNTAAVAGEAGDESLIPEITRSLMRLLVGDSDLRARIFAPSGELIADSFMLLGPGGMVQVMDLPPPDAGSMSSRLGSLYDQIANWLPGMSGFPVYREEAIQRAENYLEVVRALGGDSTGMVRADSDGRLVLFMAVPVQRYRQVLGAMLLSTGGDEITAAVRARRQDVLLVFGVALAATVLISLYLAGTLARPIRRLAAAADKVRYGKGRKFEIPDFSHRGDEIGELSESLREMTEALWARLDAIENFAADVAHEIKNPLTSLRSAVETVARVEDPGQQKKLMSIILDDVQRLDRLISDISDASRLDAELSREEGGPVDVAKLLEALVEVHKATLGDDGPRFKVDVARDQRLVVAGLEGRLGQVFRNLISNAISFSPKHGTIRLGARRQQGWCVITVSDEGPGIPPGKLDDVFDRFYSERPEGEKFGTHSGLGLSISRQIIEAHGGSVRAVNRTDEEGRVIGARFIVRLPAEP